MGRKNIKKNFYKQSSIICLLEMIDFSALMSVKFYYHQKLQAE